MCNFIQTRVAISASPFREGTVLRGAVSKENRDEKLETRFDLDCRCRRRD
jgi:hypothetical protein